jgi:hypothetical protein
MGLKMGMSRQDTLSTLYGEFMDLLSCDAISHGTAKEKHKPKKMDFDEFMALR